jgi:hypothetical protein
LALMLCAHVKKISNHKMKQSGDFAAGDRCAPGPTSCLLLLLLGERCEAAWLHLDDGPSCSSRRETWSRRGAARQCLMGRLSLLDKHPARTQHAIQTMMLDRMVVCPADLCALLL